MTLTLAVNHVVFPEQPSAYPLAEPEVSAFWIIALLAMLLLFPILFLAFGLFVEETVISRPSMRKLGLGFGLASLYMLLMILANVFTSAWAYIDPLLEPVSRNRFWLVHGIVGLVLFTLTSLVTANAIVRERERGTIEQLIVTPIRPWELVIGKITPYILLAFMNTAEVLLIGSLWFKVPIRGSLSLVFAMSGIFLLTSLGVGLLASSFASTQQEAMLIVYMIFLPSVFLSGFFFPIEAMPKFLQWISYGIPLKYYLNIIRTLLLKGAGIVAIQEDAIALLVFGIALMTAASLRIRKRLD